MPLPVSFFSLCLIALCIWASYIDLLRFRIPDLASLLILVVGIAAIGWIDLLRLPSHLMAAVFAGATFWLVGEVLYRRYGTEMLGIGDAKLLGAGAMWVGFAGLPSLLLVAAVSCIVYSLLVKRYTKRIPFGPFLALGIVTIWLYGPIGF